MWKPNPLQTQRIVQPNIINNSAINSGGTLPKIYLSKSCLSLSLFQSPEPLQSITWQRQNENRKMVMVKKKKITSPSQRPTLNALKQTCTRLCHLLPDVIQILILFCESYIVGSVIGFKIHLIPCQSVFICVSSFPRMIGQHILSLHGMRN